MGGAPSPSGLYTVEGLVSLEGRGFPGAKVYAFLPENLPAGAEKWSGSAESGPNGRFSMELPEGQYLLFARGPGKFAWFGRNPLRVSAHQRGLSLPLVNAMPEAAAEAQEGGEGIGGRVVHSGIPVEGVRVSAYLRADAGFRGQPYAMSAITGPDGKYSLSLEPGSYFITARKRSTGQEVGPLVPGDLIGVLPELPLTLAKGKAVKSDIELVELPSYEQQSRYRTRFARLSGVVLGDGKPAEGFRACIYDNPKMLGEPIAVSAPTGPDGRFTISLANVGRFYLGAREHLGGPPASGERVGFAKDAPPGGYEINPGKIIENIEVHLMVAP